MLGDLLAEFPQTPINILVMKEQKTQIIEATWLWLSTEEGGVELNNKEGL